MNRLFWLALVLSTAGCVTQVDDPPSEGADDQVYGLEGARTGAEGRTSGGALDPSLANPASEGSDPSGPTPYPWDPALCDDPNGGPTPYPWKEGSESSGQSAGTEQNGSGAEQESSKSKN